VDELGMRAPVVAALPAELPALDPELGGDEDRAGFVEQPVRLPVLQDTFRDRIAAELPEGDPNESFPALMERYTETKSRRELLQRIVERFDYIDAFPELRDNATRFHRELATLFYVQDIVTTNWDPYFEQETGALPFVTDKDLLFRTCPVGASSRSTDP
jgi:hypothetical protein